MPAFTNSDGIPIAYETFGPLNGQAFLLVHGFASTYTANWIGTSWANTLVAEGFRVVLMDVRGHGDSGKPKALEAYTMRRLVQDLTELLDHLDISKAHLMGYSMGGMISLMASALDSQRWLKVIAGGVGANLLRSDNYMADVIDVFECQDDTERAQLLAKSTNAPLFLSFALANRQDLEALALCMRKVPRPFPFMDLPPISNPLLIVVGDQDTHAGSAEALLPFLPTAQVVSIPDRDHMKTVGDKLYKQAVLDFVKEPVG